MKISTTLRKSLTALALGVMSVGGTAVAVSSPASASLDVTPLITFHNLQVTNVTVYDVSLQQRNQANPPAQSDVFNYGQPWINPLYTQANDQINVCFTVTASLWATTAPTKVSVTGPDYNWVGSVPALAKGASYSPCTGLYTLNFTHAAALGLISTGYQGVKYPGRQCVPIVLTASSTDSSAPAKGFWQSNLSNSCGFPAPVIG